MSDDVGLNDEDDINQADMISYLNTKGVNADCELCGASDWNYGSQINGARPTLSFAKTSSPNVQHGFIEMIIGNCTNCGNIRLFNRWFYEHWKLGQDSKGHDDVE